MTIFDIALDHQRQREQRTQTYPVSAQELEIAAMIGQTEQRSRMTQDMLLLQPLTTQPVDLDMIEEAYLVLDVEEDDVVYAD